MSIALIIATVSKMSEFLDTRDRWARELYEVLHVNIATVTCYSSDALRRFSTMQIRDKAFVRKKISVTVRP